MGNTLRLAWRNLGRNTRRTTLIVVAIAVAQTSVLLMAGLMNGFVARIVHSLTGPMTGHAQVHDPLWREERAPDLVIDDLARRLQAVRSVEGVSDAYARIYAPALAAREVDGHPATVIGIDVDREARPGGLLEGLDEIALPRGHEVLIGSTFARHKGFEVGDEIALIGTGADGSQAHDIVRVRGTIHSPMDLLNRSGIVLPLESAQEIFAMEDRAHEITIRGAEPPEVAQAMAAQVARAEGMGGLEVLAWQDLSPQMVKMMEAAGLYAGITLLVLFAAALAGVLNAMLMSTYERRRELGMLLALGTTPRRIVEMVVAEAVALGLLGVSVGTALGTALVSWQGQVGINMVVGSTEEHDTAVFGVSYAAKLFPYLDVGDAVPGFVAIVFVAIVAALWPAVRTARMQPMEALR